MRNYYFLFILVTCYLFISVSTRQEPEINDQFETNLVDGLNDTKKHNHSDDVRKNTTVIIKRDEVEQGFWIKFYEYIKAPIIRIINLPKIRTVLRDVGTCFVNGAMEIISFYAPAPLIPLIATAAGMIIPFEPVVMLREKMPVNSYRRAFKQAMDSFMGTFDKYKNNAEEDPYMTRRFNRRFMDKPEKKTSEFIKYVD